MRILQVITSLRTGGAERMVVELSKRIARAGDTVEVLLFDGTHTPMCDELQAEGVRIHSLGSGETAMHNPLLICKLKRFLKHNDYDVIHTHNTPCQVLTAFSRTERIMVTTEHNTFNRRRNYPILRPFDCWMYARYRSIVCVSAETQSELSSWLGREGIDKRISVIPNGIDIALYCVEALSDNTSFKKDHIILMVSAFRAQKDHATLIRAMNSLPADYHLLLVGGSETSEDEKTLESCKGLVRSLNLEHRVSFLGVRNDVPELLASCDVAVLSSHYEGFGLFAVEAMASGKPLIASDVDDLNTLVGGAGILFPEGDAEKLAGAIWEVCENPDKAREIGERCRARAQAYDINETVRRYRELYGRIPSLRSE